MCVQVDGQRSGVREIGFAAALERALGQELVVDSQLKCPPQLLLADVVLVGYRPLAPGECCGMILATRLSSTCRRFGWQVRRRENWRARPETWCVWSPGAGMWLVQRPSDWCQWCGCQTSSCRGSVLLQWTCNANGVVVVVKDTLMVWPWYCHAHALARMIWETRHTRLLRYCHAANV